jgi:hypothetical protein
MESNAQEKRKPFSKGIIPQAAHIIGWVIIGLGFVGLFALVFGVVVKWLWNMLMPAVFGLGEITFWQAFGIVILAKLLFGGFSPRRYNRSHRDYRASHDGYFPWKRSRDQRQDLKSNYRNWKYYHRFWHDEGEAAFEAYIDRKRKEEQPKKTAASMEPAPDDSPPIS